MGWNTLEKGAGFFLSTENIRSITPKEMSKNGMRVMCRNNSMWTYIDGHFTCIGELTPRLSWLSEFEKWTDDLSRFNNVHSDWDVMEIGEAPPIYYYFDYSRATPVIWEREEKSKAEKQLEEIQANIQSLTEQAIELGKQIEQEKL